MNFSINDKIIVLCDDKLDESLVSGRIEEIKTISNKIYYNIKFENDSTAWIDNGKLFQIIETLKLKLKR